MKRDFCDWTNGAMRNVDLKARGICLYGEPICRVFPDVAVEDYLDSIARDADWSYANILRGPDSGECSVPPYAVLNFCRVLAFIAHGQITSKAEGGQWGIEHLPQGYTPVIREALKEYTSSGTAGPVDAKLLKQFAIYARVAIQHKRGEN